MTFVVDIDGVIHRGGRLLPGSDRALERAATSELGLLLATNNSTTSASQVRQRLAELTGVTLSVDSVVTSSQAAVDLIADTDGPVLVFGSTVLSETAEAAGRRLTDIPEEAAAVLVGMDFDLTYERLTTAMDAVNAGARFVATNTDATFPIADRFLPGGGAIVAALQTATGVTPEVAGKPHAPMRSLLKSRGAGAAWVVGDRVDTDIAMANAEEGWRSVLVRTGVYAGGDDGGADYVVEDFAAAVDLVLSDFSQR